jgi:hypothetical protein
MRGILEVKHHIKQFKFFEMPHVSYDEELRVPKPSI